jgi:hypothetical protein
MPTYFQRRDEKIHGAQLIKLCRKDEQSLQLEFSFNNKYSHKLIFIKK